MEVTPLDDVAARYAPARPARARWTRRLLVVAGAVALVLVFLGVASTVLEPEARWRDVAFEVVSDEQVLVTFEVYGRAGDELRCQVRATGSGYGDVGQVDVDLGPLTGSGERTTVELRTLGRASSASVRTCVLRP